MRTYHDFEKAGFVSVWVGDSMDAGQLDDYLNLSRKFENDFGFALDERNMPETIAEQHAVPISTLLGGFSWCDHFKDAVIEAAERLGVHSASAVIVFFNFRYEPSTSPKGGPFPARFLCAVPF